MTKKELWHIRIGTRVQKTEISGHVSKGTVIHRQVEDETCGFMIAREKKTGNYWHDLPEALGTDETLRLLKQYKETH